MTIQNIKSFIENSYKEFRNWHKFTINNPGNVILYNTFHSSKGEEYPNVEIFINENFAVSKEYFKSAYNYIIHGKDLSQSVNLLYVVFTKAIKNMAIIYTGDNPETKK